MSFLQGDIGLAGVIICLLLTSNIVALNLNKTNVLVFVTNDSPQYEFNIGYNEKRIEEIAYTE
jgi:hypothetical protein